MQQLSINNNNHRSPMLPSSLGSTKLRGYLLSSYEDITAEIIRSDISSHRKNNIRSDHVRTPKQWQNWAKSGITMVPRGKDVIR